MKFEGTASSTTVDREGERMTTRALEAMARGGRVELRDGHRGEKIGVVEECRREGERLTVRGTLEPSSPRAQALWDKLRAGVRLALSVGGRKRVVSRYSPVAGRRVRMIEEARLEHVAVVRPEEARNEETGIVASGESRVASGERDAQALPLPSEPPPPERSEGEGAGGEASPASPPPLATRDSPLATPGRSRSLPGQKSGRRQTQAASESSIRSLPHTNDELWKGVL
jgi:hypothetical protein